MDPLRLSDASDLGGADGFPPVTIQNNLAPELEHNKGQQVIGMIASFR
jgi:hypothetical protein